MTDFRNLVIILTLLCSTFVAQGQSFKDEQNRFPRVREAREQCSVYLDSLFRSHGLTYPPPRIIIVAYKLDRILELWARDETTDTYILIKQYPFTAYSGTLGPKRKRGDLQIPEGFYKLTHFNPYSNFHLSMLVSYPNHSDMILSPYPDPGGEIRIHGSCVTIGCIPIGDAAIKELYITCVDVKSQGHSIPVYIFPTYMDIAGMLLIQNDVYSDSTLRPFWYNIKQGYDIFSTTRKELDYSINDQGVYIFKNTLYTYPWHAAYTRTNCLSNRIAVPPGYNRILAPVLSFAGWLRELPLKPGTPLIKLFDNSLKTYQDGHAAIIDIDIGTKDLQQCADAVMRLYAEYLYSTNAYDKISFLITNSDTVRFRTWINGYRPSVDGNIVRWNHISTVDSSYNALRDYLEFIFSYAGSYSLSKQLHSVPSLKHMNVGDIFIQGGFPGHAVIVVDMAMDPQNQDTVFLLTQSYMPAQDIHILKNLNDPEISPWYSLDFDDTLYTPEWTFTKNDLMRF